MKNILDPRWEQVRGAEVGVCKTDLRCSMEASVAGAERVRQRIGR